MLMGSVVEILTHAKPTARLIVRRLSLNGVSISDIAKSKGHYIHKLLIISQVHYYKYGSGTADRLTQGGKNVSVKKMTCIYELCRKPSIQVE